MRFGPFALFLLVLLMALPARAEDGYALWLRYQPVERAQLSDYRAHASQIVRPSTPTPTTDVTLAELERGLSGLLDRPAVLSDNATRNGAIVFGSPASSSLIAGLNLDLAALGDEGFLIRSMRVNGRNATVIAGNTDVGALYGAFEVLRRMQTRQPLDEIDYTNVPRVQLRTLNHWDNLDGMVERGYSGFSIFDWHRLPDYVDPRITDYARANASVGINSVVVNNVNANATSLTPEYLRKAAALADVLRPYGITLYLTARFSSPIEIGGLDTADPLNPAVREWWRNKANEIYAVIPDFGGFLVKANSEGQPGPQDYTGPIPQGATMTGARQNARNYQRTHADGANMMAEALAPHGGIVMWRAFVYSAENTRDRHMQAVDDFVPLDGQFLPNVVVQTKNGAIDFQPREPIHPLFGAMPRTPVTLELQITKEYLGQGTHLAYLGPMWEEALDTDTYIRGEGDTVARIVDGSVFPYPITGMAGVANIGTDRNWSGSVFDQANWYAYGRFAWDHDLSAEGIAEEWARMTFSNDPRFVEPTVAMMMGSREAVVDYTGAYGLGHLFATGHHYGPGPWVCDLARPEWNPCYYHKADANGIGFDRTATGSNGVSQYSPTLAARYGSLETVPEEFLLWFHHVPWTHRLSNGETVWDGLVHRYSRGVEEVRAMQRTWDTMRPFVDEQRWAQTAAFLRIQEREAQWWRDASVAYFQSKSGLALPAGEAAPPHPLAYYEAIESPYAPGHH